MQCVLQIKCVIIIIIEENKIEKIFIVHQGGKLSLAHQHARRTDEIQTPCRHTALLLTNTLIWRAAVL